MRPKLRQKNLGSRAMGSIDAAARWAEILLATLEKFDTERTKETTTVSKAKDFILVYFYLLICPTDTQSKLRRKWNGR